VTRVDAAHAADALAGVRVIEVANFLAGPLIGMFLADFGADVVKVERPGKGDECRYWGHNRDGVGLYHKVVNRNKRSVTADLHTPTGQRIVRRLADGADVLVENFRPGTMERWNLGYAELATSNPGLVMVRVSAYGQTGPYRERPGFGTLAEAFAGYAHITGERGGPPLLPAFGLADATTGLMGAMLTLVALTARDGGGGGQLIDLAIYEALFSLLGPQVIDFDQLGIVQGRNGSRLPFTAPRNTFVTADGRWVAVGGSAQSVFERICRALDREDLVDDPSFVDNRARIEHAEELDEQLQSAIGKLEFDELMRRFAAHGAAAAPVQSVDEVMDDPQVRARENVVAVDDPELGRIRMQGVAGRRSATPGRIVRSGPVLGESNEAILVEELGFDRDELRRSGCWV
jgi:crotonobetainyl-CoA:carnitine CoA-transferase CaiB-like acyl-CoA transferase